MTVTLQGAPGRQSGPLPRRLLRRRLICGAGVPPAAKEQAGRLRHNLLRRRAQTVLACCLLAAVALQGVLYVVMAQWPQIRDPEYGFKLARLREQLAEKPDRPLILLFGSSRSGVGLDPRQFGADRAGDAPPLVFNFALSGAGPIRHLMLLRTLLDQQVRPRRLLLELHPLFLNQGCGALREECRIDVHRLDRVAMETLADYSLDPEGARRRWWEGRLLVAHGNRHELLDCLLPKLCARFPQYNIFRQINSWGWLAFPGRAKDEDGRQKLVERARAEYRDSFPNFAVTGEPDRALHALLSLCREKGITVTIYIMPEGSEFRSWYPSGARQQVSEYLGGLKREYSFDLHDLTSSMPDESFADSHHLLPEVVARFSTRFALEVMGENEPDGTPIGRNAVAKRSPIPASGSRR
ncbi:MAG TPA: hypothetical protein VG125_25650 [Pirellulales bacterium]|jgi:hypothetical protein|nr:hypothetical protein [Pirellulales bacterium]